MVVATAGLALQPRIDSDLRDSELSAALGVKVTSPTTDDMIAIAICAGVFGLTAILLVFAWCNYNYRPIRAKNLTWTTLIYLSTVLWFLGDIPSNGHVRLVGMWSNCKLWIIWFRVFFCFVFATMCIVRFYALDRVFNQKKPFTVWSSLISGVAVISVNVVYCLVNQLISDSLTIKYDPEYEVCNVTQGFRISALTFMWIIWAAVGVLFFRLRNIQSTFNEFYESIAIFAVIIGLLIESSISNLYYIYFILEKRRRIQKTVVDMAAGNLVIWLFIGYPVFMCIFHREKYEQQWLERLAQDSPNHAFNKNNNMANNGTSYAKMNDNFEATFYNDQRLGSMDMSALDYNQGHHPFSNNSHPLNIESALNCEPIFDGNALPSAMRNNLHIQQPEMNPPTMFTTGYMAPNSNGRHVI